MIQAWKAGRYSTTPAFQDRTLRTRVDEWRFLAESRGGKGRTANSLSMKFFEDFCEGSKDNLHPPVWMETDDQIAGGRVGPNFKYLGD
jgi:hypothetical protein